MPQDDMLHKQQQIQAEPIHMEEEYAQPLQVMEENIHQNQDAAAPFQMEQAVVHQVAEAPAMEAPVQQQRLTYKERLEQKKTMKAEKKREKIMKKEELRQQKAATKQKEKEAKDAKKEALKLEKQKAAENKVLDKGRPAVVEANTAEMKMVLADYANRRKEPDLEKRMLGLAEIGITQTIVYSDVPFYHETGAIKNQILKSGGEPKAIMKAMDILGDFMRSLDIYNVELENKDVAIQSLIPNLMERDLASGVPQEEVLKRKEIYVKQAEARWLNFQEANHENYAEILDFHLSQIKALVNIDGNYQENMKENSEAYWAFNRKAKIEHAQDRGAFHSKVEELEAKYKVAPTPELLKELENMKFKEGSASDVTADVYYLRKHGVPDN